MFRQVSKAAMRGSTRAFSSSASRSTQRASFSPKLQLLSLCALAVGGYYLSSPVVLLEGENKPKKKVETAKEESKADEEAPKKQKSDETEEKVEGDKATKVEGEEDGEPKQQAAYNPETGEINWDCPCLGGMAHGPCGEEFKEAFSCFVYSEAEPKGIDCVEKFKNMQNCFRKYPEIYSEEIRDEDTHVDNLEAEAPDAPVAAVEKENVVVAVQTPAAKEPFEDNLLDVKIEESKESSK